MPERGLTFGCHDYRSELKKAAQGVLTPADLANFAAYDFRHARVTELAEQGHLTGAAFNVGHRKVSTTDLTRGEIDKPRTERWRLPGLPASGCQPRGRQPH